MVTPVVSVPAVRPRELQYATCGWWRGFARSLNFQQALL